MHPPEKSTDNKKNKSTKQSKPDPKQMNYRIVVTNTEKGKHADTVRIDLTDLPCGQNRVKSYCQKHLEIRLRREAPHDIESVKLVDPPPEQ